MHLKLLIFAATLIGSAHCKAVNYISNGGAVGATATISSPNGNYTLKVVSNSLNVYRRDGSIRAVVAQGGYAATMQADGNLVFRNGPGFAVWNSGTTNGVSNHLIIYDDGNLTIELPAPFLKTVLWELGVDGSPTAFEQAQPPGLPPSTIPAVAYSNTPFTIPYPNVSPTQ